MSQGGTRKKTEQKQISVALTMENLGPLRQRAGRHLEKCISFSTSRTCGRGAEENATSLEFSTSKGTEDKLGKVPRQAFPFFPESSLPSLPTLPRSLSVTSPLLESRQALLFFFFFLSSGSQGATSIFCCLSQILHCCWSLRRTEAEIFKVYQIWPKQTFPLYLSFVQFQLH